MSAKALLTVIGLAVGTLAVLFRLWLKIAALPPDVSALAVPFHLFATFTIIVNIALVCVYGAEIGVKQLAWFRVPLAHSMALAATLLMSIYHDQFMGGLMPPTSAPAVVDTVLHYVTPGLYLVWWLLFSKHGVLRWADVPMMLLPPTIYLIYVMIRGAIVTEYPYPILEAHRLGYAAVAINVVGVLMGLTVLSTIVVAIDRALTRVDLPGP
jgi:hypothetical protein